MSFVEIVPPYRKEYRFDEPRIFKRVYFLEDRVTSVFYSGEYTELGYMNTNPDFAETLTMLMEARDSGSKLVIRRE